MRGSRFWRGLGIILEDGTALAAGLFRAQDQSHGAEHEHDGAPSGGSGHGVGRAARAESRLAASAAESSGKISGLAAL
jgi:hypothetical protein